MAYVWRALLVADLPGWSAFTRIVADADDTGETYPTDALGEELADPGIDPAHDTVAVEDERGTLVAVGQVLAPTIRGDGVVRASFAGFVHPAHRGRGIGSELLDRLDARAGDSAARQHPRRTVRRSTQVGSAVGGARALLEGRGYHAVRHFHALGRDLGDARRVDDPRVQPYDSARDAEVHDAHCDAFRTHWGFAPPTPERWRNWYTGSRTFRPQYSVLGLGPSGAVDGYVLGYQYEPGELWIGQIGVRPAARGRGLARAMLQQALAQAAGECDVAKLDVDSENADGAGRLYESMGFLRQRGSVVYER
jgi:ribosomal protein S18 acetylase RimI-like enzyme